MSVKTFDVKHFNSVSRSSHSEDQWSLFFSFFLSHIRRNRLILFYSILWGLTFEYSIICQRHIISDSDVAHYSTPFPTVVCGIYSCNVTRFLFRQVFFFHTEQIFYRLHPDNERLQPWDELCALFKSFHASALSLKRLCSASFCCFRKYISFFTFPPQITVVDTKITEPNGHKHSRGKWKTWQMVIWQPKMDVFFLCEHIFWVVVRLKKTQKQNQVPTKVQKNRKMTENIDNQWEWPRQ